MQDETRILQRIVSSAVFQNVEHASLYKDGWRLLTGRFPSCIRNDVYFSRYLKELIIKQRKSKNIIDEDTHWLSLNSHEIYQRIEEIRLQTEVASKTWARAYREIDSEDFEIFGHSECLDSYVYVFRGHSYRGDGETAISLHLPAVAGSIAREVLRRNPRFRPKKLYDLWLESHEFLICSSSDRYPPHGRDHTACGYGAHIFSKMQYEKFCGKDLNVSGVFLFLNSIDIFV